MVKFEVCQIYQNQPPPGAVDKSSCPSKNNLPNSNNRLCKGLYFQSQLNNINVIICIFLYFISKDHNYKMFVDGNIVANDMFLTQSDKISKTSLTKLVVKLLDRVDQLSKEVAQLKVKTKTKPIYTKDSN